MAERVTALMDKPERIRNIGIVAHIDHGKTTLSDNLLAGAGMISMELAGKQLFMDFDPLEQARGITIDSANVSMVHEYKGQEYLINMIDTPGHVDFGGDVTRAMRAVDGAVVVVDAVEGAMPQTETVLRQALKENVHPVLFVNKVDRLLNELKVDKQEMQLRLGKLIDNINKLIRGMNEEKYKAGWKVDAAEGSVAFGSALYNWAISVPQMKSTGIGFGEVYDYCQAGDMETLAERCPLYVALNDMVISFLPSPLKAQKERVGVIWHGDRKSNLYQSMEACDPAGPVAFMVTDISVDPHAGEVATGRLFSGTLERGMELSISGVAKPNRVQQTGIFMGADRIEVEHIPAGNIAAVTGLRDAFVGSTVSSDREATPFEDIKHVSEPVVTVAVEAKNTRDLPKLVEVLRQVAKEDPTLNININEETGEHLMAGMGELHLEIVAYRIQRDKGVEITTSPPIVVYRESITGKTSGAVEGKSPNHHNRFYIEIEPLEQEVVDSIKAGEFSMKMEEIERRNILISKGMDKEEARNISGIFESNVFINMTKGVQYLRETMELMLEGFVEATKNGPICREPVQGVKAKLIDIKLHEDAIHRGPAQVIPAVRQAVQAGILMANPTLLEPFQNVFIQVPQEQMGGAMSEIQGRRGMILSMETEGDMIIIKAKAPVSELFGFAGAIRGATEGRSLWSTEFAGFEPIPPAAMVETVRQIRGRKGLKTEMPKPSDYLKA
ncbi:elongation factor EF-2 [Methanotrichaceae archaeon Mx]|uniref:Elongation factor 2 n=2 Tax=Candidatus Methanocrinis natronophilus TaxID=3033396 RepID=A0ABT5X951_9EURY|nr:elongation factor EF-2 [Candidatus Methanocrinis natronophilus]MDF0591229.1 elongation factor EF-2 [Candidatus Methanocrinis natronophilus]